MDLRSLYLRYGIRQTQMLDDIEGGGVNRYRWDVWVA